jgi:hypothetical protein
MQERELICDEKKIQLILLCGNFLLLTNKDRWNEILLDEYDFLAGI